MEKLSKQQVKTILLNAPEGSDNNLIINGLVSKGYILEGYNDKPKPDGFVKSVAKDAVNTLVVKPGQRATEAATRIFAPNSMAAKGYESMADSGESQKFNVPGLGEIDAGQQKAFGSGGGRQIAGETLKIGSYLFPYGKVAGAVGNVTSKVAGNVASGVAGGYMADVGYNLSDENKSLGESFIPGVGTAIGAAIPLLGPAAKALKGKGRNSSDTVKRVIQGETKDIPLAEQAFKNIDLKGVKTRQELSTRLADAMENQMKLVDDQLSKDPRALSLDDYAVRAKNSAGQEVKTDVISNSLAHLEDFFTKSGDNVSASNVNLIKQKAVSEGLTHQEVNNIARMYSEEFGAKAFNKIGDPLTSVNAQMYQNTRNGLKQAARGGLGYGAEAQVADKLYSAMSNTKRLIDKGVEGVNKLEGRLKNRNLFEKLSYGATKVLNAITGGSLKAGVEALGVSNVGNKIDNWVGLEQSLAKDLKFIEKANGIESESALIKFIENYAKKFKFPGDSAVDSVKNRLKSGYSENLANQRMKSTIKNTTPNNSNISKSLPKTKKMSTSDPLLQEAKKYKSAEEFVNSATQKGIEPSSIMNPTIKMPESSLIPTNPEPLKSSISRIVYRGEGGSNVSQGKSLLAEGRHFASDAEYPKGFGKVSEYILKPNAKVLDLGESTFQEVSKKLGIPEKRYISPKELSKIAKEKGYDVIQYNGEYASSGKKFTHSVDLTGDSYLTKSQLEEIWKKANKK